MIYLKDNEIISAPTAVALGLFDGVHRGHQLVIGKACEYKKQALLGDRICPYVQADEKKTVAALRNASGESFAVVEFYAG